ncbi:Flp pilus assembly protein CpaB [Marinicauda pacifica]|uniref:Flp pilus assembly protein CpaB n=1 Tax=Marinicauda pacifica TaxID=1133559 RepID=UPI0035C799FA
MNIARILILALAGLAAVAAAIFVRGAMQPTSTPAPARVEAPAQAPTAHVLASRSGLEIGQRVDASTLYWQPWPEEAMSPGYITQSARPAAIEEFSGAVARAPMAQGEPVTERKLVQPGDAGFMAVVLSPGMRAVAVPISASSGAGGFILPNDRVDVIITTDANGRMASRTAIENVRVLAIDQSYSDSEDGVVLGSTATLELAPRQAEALALGVAEGDVSLALRSIADAGEGNELDTTDTTSEPAPRRDTMVRVFRYGQEQQVMLGGNR